MSYELIGTKYSIAVLDTMFAVAKKKGLRIQVNRIQPSVILVQLSTNWADKPTRSWSFKLVWYTLWRMKINYHKLPLIRPCSYKPIYL